MHKVRFLSILSARVRRLISNLLVPILWLTSEKMALLKCTLGTTPVPYYPTPMVLIQWVVTLECPWKITGEKTSQSELSQRQRWRISRACSCINMDSLTRNMHKTTLKLAQVAKEWFDPLFFALLIYVREFVIRCSSFIRFPSFALATCKCFDATWSSLTRRGGYQQTGFVSIIYSYTAWDIRRSYGIERRKTGGGKKAFRHNFGLGARQSSSNRHRHRKYHCHKKKWRRNVPLVPSARLGHRRLPRCTFSVPYCTV